MQARTLYVRYKGKVVFEKTIRAPILIFLIKSAFVLLFLIAAIFQPFFWLFGLRGPLTSEGADLDGMFRRK
jgi:hypothetical protein